MPAEHRYEPTVSPAPYGYGWGHPSVVPTWGAPPPVPWPPAPSRPGTATAAAVLGLVTGGLTLLGALVMALAISADGTDPATVVLLLGFPCGAGLITGGVLLLNRRLPWVLLGSTLAAIGVLIAALVAGAATLSEDDALGLFFFTALALPLPIVTAAFTAQRSVRDWVSAAG
jgi:hypothetical protein